jgi:hypothetical protein
LSAIMAAVSFLGWYWTPSFSPAMP